MEGIQNEQLKTIKIAGIAGSPRKNGITAGLLLKALEGAEAAGAETMPVFLADEELEPCRGCNGSCWEKLQCVHEPASGIRNARFQDADGLVMAVPVYCWQMNGLTQMFMEKMRWNTGSVLKHLNRRGAFGITCAGGSGTGCILALQALYRYFYNWSFHGIKPLPVTPFNLDSAMDEAYTSGRVLVETIRGGLKPFLSIGAAMADLESLPYMTAGPLDELRLIVKQLQDRFSDISEPLVKKLHSEAGSAEQAWEKGDRPAASSHLSEAYMAGRQAWNTWANSAPGNNST